MSITVATRARPAYAVLALTALALAAVVLSLGVGSNLIPPAEVGRTPAAAAGHVYPWVFAGMDYVAMGQYMNELAGYLEGARKVQ